MSKLLSFEFLFRARQYYAFARVKPTEEGNEYHINVMDQEIEKICPGEITLTEKQGRILPANFSLTENKSAILNSKQADQDRTILFESISTALQQRAKESEN
jgi:hypothetical protein